MDGNRLVSGLSEMDHVVVSLHVLLFTVFAAAKLETGTLVLQCGSRTEQIQHRQAFIRTV